MNTVPFFDGVSLSPTNDQRQSDSREQLFRPISPHAGWCRILPLSKCKAKWKLLNTPGEVMVDSSGELHA